MSLEFVESIDVKKLIDMLLSAYSDEWIAAYYYTLTAYAIQGPLSEEMAEHFLKEAEEELGKHARMLGDRLQDLGVHPPKLFTTLWDLSGCKYPRLPEDPFDLDGWLIAAVKAEECAIKSYKELYAYTHGRDPVTEEIVENILRDEVKHRTDLLTLLSRDGLKRLESEG